MQHLDDAHGCAESFLSEWIKKKPGRWRILVVKDVLAMIRIVLWCPRKEWASSSNENRSWAAQYLCGILVRKSDSGTGSKPSRRRLARCCLAATRAP